MRKEPFKSILITGGGGFIGSHVVRRMVNNYPSTQITNLDSLTYASNIKLLDDCKRKSNYNFINEDINNFERLKLLFSNYDFDAVIHLAAESHVDNSIKDPFVFAQTNIQGTLNLLEAARQHWTDNPTSQRFYHISTDEVFGSLNDDGLFTEITCYNPRSPYSASKAASDHLVKSYFHTYGVPILISNCSNNYGPGQHAEKLIPLMINNIISKKILPVYGTGNNIRDWLYVEDHAEAIDLILNKGIVGESYLIGGNNEQRNIDIVKLLINLIDQKLNNPKGHSLKLIKFTEDRLGHDYRYGVDTSKIKNELKWSPTTSFSKGIEKTINFYLNN